MISIRYVALNIKLNIRSDLSFLVTTACNAVHHQYSGFKNIDLPTAKLINLFAYGEC